MAYSDDHKWGPDGIEFNVQDCIICKSRDDKECRKQNYITNHWEYTDAHGNVLVLMDNNERKIAEENIRKLKNKSSYIIDIDPNRALNDDEIALVQRYKGQDFMVPRNEICNARNCFTVQRDRFYIYNKEIR